MNFKIIFFILILLLSCKKKEELPIQVIGHAGMGLKYSGSIYHDNSREAMDLALTTPQSDGVEMDVRMASDGSLWLYHDETVDLETNSSGCIGDKTTENLKSLRYSTLKKEKVVRLMDIPEFYEGEKFLYLDIKHSNYCQSIIQDVNAYLLALNNWKALISNPNERIYIILNNPDWVSSFILDGWNVLFSSDDAELRISLLDTFSELIGFVCKNKTCSKTEVTDIKSKGKSIYLYEVRSPKALKEVRKKNPTGVMSDDLQGAIVEFK